MDLLKLENVGVQFGGLKAVDDLSMELRQGEILGLIGPNGAGKTTVFNLITGVYKPTSGTISYKGAALNGLTPHKIVADGVVRTFQNIRLFKAMTSLENVMAGLHCRTSSGVVGSIFRTKGQRAEEAASEKRAEELLKFVGLYDKRHEIAGNLAYGQQRQLEIARSLATDPQCLLLDEPAAGMNPQESLALVGMIKRILKLGVSVLLVEHDMKVVMGISHRLVVLDSGQKIAEGAPSEIQRNPEVIRAYLGSLGATG